MATEGRIPNEVDGRRQRKRRVISNVATQLFDSDWYLLRYPDVVASDLKPFDHYLIFGANEGREPNVFFDSAWYRAGAGPLDVTPLEDYATDGVAAGRDPNPLFDSAWYLATNPDVAAQRINPLAHYISRGAIEGRNPHPLFESRWYTAQNPGVGRMNPLQHFLQWGMVNGVSPHPLFDSGYWSRQRAESQGVPPFQDFRLHGSVAHADPHLLFSTAWYLANYPDVRLAGANPLEHYLRRGAVEGRNPHPLFDGVWYLKENPDVAASGVNPLVHYVLTGARELRSPHPLFDGRFYLGQQRETEVAAAAPLEHYLTLGWRRGLRPNRDFDPTFYLDDNPDVRAKGVEPLTHYVVKGRIEGRLGLPPAIESIAAATPSARTRRVSPAPPAQLPVRIEPMPKRIRLAVSVLFFHREDLIDPFLRKLLPQIHAACSADLEVELFLGFNYEPSVAVLAQIKELPGRESANGAPIIHVIRHGHNLGFGAGHNALLQREECDLLVVLNSDVRMSDDDWLQRIAERFRSSEVAIIGLTSTASHLREDGCGIPVEPDADFDFVDGSVLSVRTDLARRFGLFAEAFDPFYFEDADLCLRYRQIGLAIERIDLRCEHDRSSSARVLPRFAVGHVLNRNRAQFFARWSRYIESRQLPNRIGVLFTDLNRAFQCASLPALMALLRDHPTAIVDVAGVHEQLRPLFEHPRIRVIPAWQSLQADDYSRYHELAESTSGTESRPLEIARQIGCWPDFAAARVHLEQFGSPSPSQRGAFVFASRPEPLFAGREPAAAAWALAGEALSARGYQPTFYTDLATFELAELQSVDTTEVEQIARCPASEIVRELLCAEVVIGRDSWVVELAQQLEKETFVWLGAISPLRALSDFRQAGFFQDRTLPCLGCYHRFGERHRNTCLRGDVACMRDDLGADLAVALDQFLTGRRPAAADVIDRRFRTDEHRPAASDILSLDRWPRSSAASVLVLIPTNPLLSKAATDRARALAGRSIEGMRASRVILDSTGEAPLRGLPHPHRQAAMAAIRQGMIDRHLRDEQWVFWVDADIVAYPEDLIDELIARAEGGIAAPLVLMQGDLDEPLSNKFGFGPGRFYDVAGFVEHGRWARFTPPYFDQPGPVYQLDSVGSCYLVNADLYRHGAKHSLDPASREFIESESAWADDAITRNQAAAANCFTEHYTVCEFARSAGLPVQAFADLVAYHEKP